MFYIYRKIIIILFAVSLNACENLPQNPEYWMELEKNACLPTAVAFKRGLDRQGIWSEVIRYEFKNMDDGKKAGHAVVAYMYPAGKNKLWTYDYMGSYRVRAYKNDPLAIARESILVRGNWNHNVYFAEFLK
jgi:hypothetical protein